MPHIDPFFTSFLLFSPYSQFESDAAKPLSTKTSADALGPTTRQSLLRLKTYNSSFEDVAGKSDASRSLGDPFGRHGEVVVDFDSLGDAWESCCCVAGVKT